MSANIGPCGISVTGVTFVITTTVKTEQVKHAQFHDVQVLGAFGEEHLACLRHVMILRSWPVIAFPDERRLVRARCPQGGASRRVGPPGTDVLRRPRR